MLAQPVFRLLRTRSRLWRYQLAFGNHKGGNIEATSDRAGGIIAPPRTSVATDEHPGGASSIVGPTFFAGRATEVSGSDQHPQWAGRRRTLGWASAATVVLVAFVGLESQRWLSRTSGSQYETVALIRPVLNLLRGALPQKSAPTTTSVAAGKQLPSIATSATTSQASKNPQREQLVARGQVLSGQKPKPAGTQVSRTKVDDLSARQASLKQASVKGDTDAPVILANMYLEGKGAPRSCDEAVAVLEVAAAQSNVRAQNRLAGLYATGSCVRRDPVQAYRWLRSALATDPENHWARQNLELTWRQMTEEERNALVATAH